MASTLLQRIRSFLPRKPIALAVATAVVVIPIVSGILLVRSASDDEPQSPPPPAARPTAEPEPASPRDRHVSVVAQARESLIRVYRSPRADDIRRKLRHPTPVGAPLVFLVEEQRDEWLKVLLPTRPNGSTGWIRAAKVRLSQHRYRIEVQLRTHRLTLYRGEKVRLRAPIGVGTTDTPTPGGTFYIKELLEPPDPNSVYGSYAYGLSGFSNVLRKFGGGQGVIGIHGTNDPSSIGGDVSHGCIRLRNAVIERLVPILPLGTPVRILR